MMVKPSVNQLLKIKGVDNRYTLVVMTAKRARQIAAGDKAMTDVNEIAEGKVTKI